MKTFALLALAVQAAIVSASPGIVKRDTTAPAPTSTNPGKPDASISPIRAPQCKCPGEYLCCKELVNSANKRYYEFYEKLGVTITGTSIQIGVECQRIYYLNGLVEKPPAECNVHVCCSDTKNAEIAAFGCFETF